MKFDKHFPTVQLQPYIKYFVVSENELESEYKVFPSSGLVIGFSVTGILTYLLNYKLPQTDQSTSLVWFKKWFFLILSPTIKFDRTNAIEALRITHRLTFLTYFVIKTRRVTTDSKFILLYA